MADSIELRMSVTSIKRVDPYVKEILATATHVALYKFNTTTNEWEKTETEGALFVYSRNGEPFHSIMVMNRLNTDNLIEPIVKDFDYQMQVPFLLYRNSNNKIFGIWFFNREECIRITYLIESIMEGLKEKSAGKSKKKENGVDIFSMLSKAHQDFNKTPIKQDHLPPCSSTPRTEPRAPDVTSKSVMDFFAKAGSKSTQKPPASNENVLQRLMSNPAHSVEHIEKQQRSITPQEQLKTPIDRKAEANNENGVSFKAASPHQAGTVSSPLAFLLQGQNAAASNVAENVEVLGTSPFAQFLETQKPLLMTPMMFTTPTGAKEAAKPKEEEKLEQVDLLTEKQLAKALIHLLRTNSEFTKKIHEAYVESIMEKVNANSSVI